VQSCGAFVFGAASFADKLSSGVAIALVQQFSPRMYVYCYSTHASSSVHSCAHKHLQTFFEEKHVFNVFLMFLFPYDHCVAEWSDSRPIVCIVCRVFIHYVDVVP